MKSDTTKNQLTTVRPLSGTTVLVVIVNYRTPQDTCNTLKTLAPELVRLPQMKVVVTDNRSGDGSVEAIQHAIDLNGWQAWASVMPLAENGGFAFGNNAAIRRALETDSGERPDYVMLLNPDTLVEQDAIAELAEYMNRHDRVGVAGSNVFLADGQPQTAARRLPTPISEFEQQVRTGAVSQLLKNYIVNLPIETRESVDCEWVSGAAMMVRTEVFRRIGLIDEAYFLYFEEVDFCGRALDAGYRIVVCPKSRIIHLEGVATKISETRKRRGRFWYESRRRFFIKRYGVWGLIKADFLWVTGRAMGRLIDMLRVHSAFSSDPKWFVWDLIVGDARAIFTSDPMGGPPKTSV